MTWLAAYADLADHAHGVPLQGFNLHQLSVLDGYSDEAAGRTDTAEAVPGLHHHFLPSGDSEMKSVRLRRIALVPVASVSRRCVLALLPSIMTVSGEFPLACLSTHFSFPSQNKQ